MTGKVFTLSRCTTHICCVFLFRSGDYLSLPFQAVLCSLAGAEPSTGKEMIIARDEEEQDAFGGFLLM